MSGGGGKVDVVGPDQLGTVHAHVLRYEPDAYQLCDYYSRRAEDSVEILDRSGPFWWKFQRTLSYVLEIANNIFAMAEDFISAFAFI